MRSSVAIYVSLHLHSRSSDLSIWPILANREYLKLLCFGNVLLTAVAQNITGLEMLQLQAMDAIDAHHYSQLWRVCATSPTTHIDQ